MLFCYYCYPIFAPDEFLDMLPPPYYSNTRFLKNDSNDSNDSADSSDSSDSSESGESGESSESSESIFLSFLLKRVYNSLNNY